MEMVPGLTLYTTIRNRLHHLQQTLPVNMALNTDARTRFLVLDYGSTDGLWRYLHEQFREQLDTRRLLYYRFRADNYSQSHSRNLAVRLAGTTMVANLDADNFAGPDYDRYILEQLSGKPEKVVTGLGNTLKITDAFGKTALHKRLFERVNGFDESFAGYGFEDYDLFYRLEKAGADLQILTQPEYLKAIKHSDSERVGEEFLMRQLYAVYNYPMDARHRALLYLYKDATFQYGIITDNQEGAEQEDNLRYSLAGGQWQPGQWMHTTDGLSLQFSGFSAIFTPDAEETQLNGHGHTFTRVSDNRSVTDLMMFNMQIGNRYRLRQQFNDPFRQVNPQGFGIGRVTQPLELTSVNNQIPVSSDTIDH